MNLKKLLIYGFLSGASLISGCTSTKKLPCLDEFWNISSQEYKIGVNDCSNMSGQFVRELWERGCDANIIEIQKLEDKQYTHVLVRLNLGKKGFFYLDPSRRQSGSDLKLMYPDYEFVRVVPEFVVLHDVEYRKIRR